MKNTYIVFGTANAPDASAFKVHFFPNQNRRHPAVHHVVQSWLVIKGENPSELWSCGTSCAKRRAQGLALNMDGVIEWDTQIALFQFNDFSQYLEKITQQNQRDFFGDECSERVRHRLCQRVFADGAGGILEK